MKPFEFFEHTADIGLIARGEDLPALFQNAALGLMSVLIDPSTSHPGGIRDRIRAEALDRETLLVNWLNEILFLYTVQQMVFCRFHIKNLADHSLDVPPRAKTESHKVSWSIEADGEGELFDPGRHVTLREVKAATFHGLEIKETPSGWEAKIILDV